MRIKETRKMTTLKTITEAVYFTLRKLLGRETPKKFDKMRKMPVIASFFKKLQTE